MSDLEHTHRPHIFPNGTRVFYPNKFASYEAFQKDRLLNAIFKRVSLMGKFLTLSNTWPIIQLLDEIEAFHNTEMVIFSGLFINEVRNLFKDYNRMIIQIDHIKQLIYFLQQNYATYPQTEQIIDKQEILTNYLKFYEDKTDIDLKMLIAHACQETNILSYEKLTTILEYFEVNVTGLSLSEVFQKLRTIIASYDIDTVKGAIEE